MFELAVITGGGLRGLLAGVSIKIPRYFEKWFAISCGFVGVILLIYAVIKLEWAVTKSKLGSVKN